MQDEEKFWKNVDKSGDCWLWTAGKIPFGYKQEAETVEQSEPVGPEQ